MKRKYPSLDAQIKEFPILQLINNKLYKNLTIKCSKDYDHNQRKLHHFIKEQEYYNNPDKFKGKQKLILMEIEVHNDIHSAMSDERFFKKWNIEKSKLLYRHRIAEEDTRRINL